jgi:transcriptional regulator with PAS, ATPase and Fis domain
VQMVKEGASDYLAKPWDDGKLITGVRNLLRIRQLQLENDRLRSERVLAQRELRSRYDLCGIVYESAALHRLVSLAVQVAAADVPVLITGPNGAGKEKLADIVHANSRRREHAFLKVNAGALPDELLESELFGSEAGAYTGSLRRRVGRFEAADGGTLFLDEIGTLSAAGQAKLLRVLQAGEFQRLGSSQTLRADVRVLAATNLDLREAMKEGRFREDLFFRLNVVTIKLPPLRERKQDIPRLVEAFLREFNIEHEKYITGISRGAMDLLMQYRWPGNVRELKNTIEGMMVLSASGRMLDVSDLPEHILRQVELKTPAADIHVRVGMTMEEIEKIAIEHTLRSVGYDKQKAAEILGIGLRTLYRKQKRYQLG